MKYADLHTLRDTYSPAELAVKCTCCGVTGVFRRIMTMDERLSVGLNGRRAVGEHNMAGWVSPYKRLPAGAHPHPQSGAGGLLAVWIDLLEPFNGLDEMLELLP